VGHGLFDYKNGVLGTTLGANSNSINIIMSDFSFANTISSASHFAK
jgi:hypothetical protein